MPARKVIITCAVTGSAHTPTMSPNLPYTVEDVVEQSVAAVEAGAAIIHLHARDPKDGRPDGRPGGVPGLPQGHQGLHGRGRLDHQRRRHRHVGRGPAPGHLRDPPRAVHAQPRHLQLRQLPDDPEVRRAAGSSTGRSPTSRAPGSSRSSARSPTSSTCSPTSASRPARASSTRPTTSATSTRWPTTSRPGLVEPPIFLQTIMGVMGGIGATVEHLAHMRSTADRLLGDAYEWSVLGAGRHQFEMITASAVMGSHVRVGLEDGLFIGRGELAESNAQQVAKISRILAELSIEVATPDEARPDPRAQGPRPGRLVTTAGRPGPDAVRTVTVVGTGVIGGGWAAHFLRRGYDVVAWDPGPGARERLAALLDNAWPALERLGLSDGAEPRPAAVGRHARGGARRHRLRAGVLSGGARRRSARCSRRSTRRPDPDVVVASSTSGLLMTDMAVDCVNPGRFLVGHPFNPPYLIPLVEVVGGEATDPEAVDLGRRVLHPGRQAVAEDGPRGARLRRQPAPGGAVARGAAHGRLRAGDGRSRSTTPSPTDQVCAGRSWARC